MNPEYRWRHPRFECCEVRAASDGAANQALILEGQCRGFRIRPWADWMPVRALLSGGICP